MSAKGPEKKSHPVTNLKKSQNRLTDFQDKGLPREEVMGERQAEVICGEGEGKRLRAKCADDQDQADRRCFDQVVEQLGPVKFRRLAGEWFAAQGTGDGESGIMARDGGKLHLEHDEAMRTYIPKLMQWSRAGLLTYHLTRKLPKHDRAAIEVEEDLRQHVVCAVACKRAKRAGVLTEERFLKDNLSSIMSKKSWELVQEAREYWRPTIVVEVPGRKNIKVWVLLVYLCILSGSPEEVAAAVSFPPTQTHTMQAIFSPVCVAVGL